MKLILASQSPRRKEILTQVGADFVTMTSNADETITEELTPEQYVCELASRKFKAVIGQVDNEDIVIAADTIVWFNNKAYGKPKTEEEAYKMLSSFSDNTHQVYTGLAIGNKSKMVTNHQITNVHFKRLTDDEIYFYIKNFPVKDKAGSYAIQERAGLFVDHIDGDFFNIVGFPICLVNEILLKDFGYKI